VTTLTLGLAARLANSDVIMLPRTSLLHLQSYLLPARFILNFYDMQTVKYFNLVGDEEDIGNERFKWSRPG